LSSVSFEISISIGIGSDDFKGISIK